MNPRDTPCFTFVSSLAIANQLVTVDRHRERLPIASIAFNRVPVFADKLDGSFEIFHGRLAGARPVLAALLARKRRDLLKHDAGVDQTLAERCAEARAA